MNPLTGIYFLLFLAVLAGMGGSYFKGYSDATTKHEQKTKEIEQQHAIAVAELNSDMLEMAREKDAEFQHRLNEMYKGYADAMSSKDKEVAAVIDSINNDNFRLRIELEQTKAEEATAELAASTAGNYAKTSARLSRKATEHFVREAKRADEITIQLGFCQDYLTQTIDHAIAYDKAIDKLLLEYNGKN